MSYKYSYVDALAEYKSLYGEIDAEFQEQWDKAWGNAMEWNSHCDTIKSFVIWFDDNLERILEIK